METSELRAAFAARLSEVCDDLGLPTERGRQTELGKRFGVTPKAARKWLNGDGFPELETAIRICNDAGVNVTWLLQGIGPKRAAESRDVAAVGEAIAALPRDDQQQALDFIKYKIVTADEWFTAERTARYLAMIDRIGKTPKPPRT